MTVIVTADKSAPSGTSLKALLSVLMSMSVRAPPAWLTFSAES